MTFPVNCVDETCPRYRILHYSGETQCRECKAEMFPVDEKMPKLFDYEFSDDMVNRVMNYKSPSGKKKPIVVQHSETFQCSPDVKGCPIASKAKVYIPVDLYNKWVFLAGQLDTEWIAYLTGKPVEDKPNEYEIDDMYFPKQKVNSVHCEADDGEIKEGTIAAVHSHVGMNAFFSKEDEEHFNHSIELVINNKGEILATGRTKLECGRWHRGSAEIIFTGCDEEMALEDELRAQITEEKKFYNFTGGKQGDLLPMA